MHEVSIARRWLQSILIQDAMIIDVGSIKCSILRRRISPILIINPIAALEIGAPLKEATIRPAPGIDISAALDLHHRVSKLRIEVRVCWLLADIGVISGWGELPLWRLIRMPDRWRVCISTEDRRKVRHCCGARFRTLPRGAHHPIYLKLIRRSLDNISNSSQWMIICRQSLLLPIPIPQKIKISPLH